MKLPTMTKVSHWVALFGLIFIEAVLAIFCLLAGKPIAYAGPVLIMLANVEFVGAVVLAVINVSKKSS